MVSSHLVLYLSDVEVPVVVRRVVCPLHLPYRSALHVNLV